MSETSTEVVCEGQMHILRKHACRGRKNIFRYSRRHHIQNDKHEVILCLH